MKSLYTILFTVLFSPLAILQNGINYKAQIKDSNGDIVVSQTIDVKFTIIVTKGPTDVYLETHTGATTDTNGIVILTIGENSTAMSLL